MGRPRSPRAPEASGGVCLLASCPVHDPVGGAVDSSVAAGWHWGARALVARGAQFRPEPWLAPKAGREPWNRVQTLVDREYEVRARPRVPSRGGGRARAQPNTLAGGYAQAYPMSIAPEPPSDLGRVGLGVSRSETFNPEA
jgi:hypothetical protein